MTTAELRLGPLRDFNARHNEEYAREEKLHEAVFSDHSLFPEGVEYLRQRGIVHVEVTVLDDFAEAGGVHHVFLPADAVQHITVAMFCSLVAQSIEREFGCTTLTHRLMHFLPDKRRYAGVPCRSNRDIGTLGIHAQEPVCSRGFFFVARRQRLSDK